MSTVEVTADRVQIDCGRPRRSTEEKKDDKKRLSLKCLADFVEPRGCSGGQYLDN